MLNDDLGVISYDVLMLDSLESPLLTSYHKKFILNLFALLINYMFCYFLVLIIFVVY